MSNETFLAMIDECKHIEIEKKVSTLECTWTNELRDEIDEFIYGLRQVTDNCNIVRAIRNHVFKMTWNRPMNNSNLKV